MAVDIIARGMAGSVLPKITSADNGKVLMVVDGEIVLARIGDQKYMPIVNVGGVNYATINDGSKYEPRVGYGQVDFMTTGTVTEI